MKSFTVCTDQIEEDEMGGTCCMHWNDEKYIQNFLQNLKRRDQLGDV
jgi:hypothetical protein